MNIQAPPGMRDFYPADMRLQNWIFDHWRAVSRQFGFEEYDAPIFEFLDLYTLKSGEGIVSELFNFEDRGGRRLAIRPEMTPSLARMVAARANALPRPIKWFSIPRMCRAERPGRGRLREFFQWNCDILGAGDVLADAEIIAVCVEFLRRVGLSPAHVAVGINSRPLMAAALETLGIPPADSDRAFQLIDRFPRLPTEEFERQWNAAHGAALECARLVELLHERSRERFCDLARRAGGKGIEAADQLNQLIATLDSLGAVEYCEFEPHFVRGLAYYTGPVFEIHARNVDLRAIAGGGRYDQLVGLLGGPDLPAVGVGMGDVVIVELLSELKLLPQLAQSPDAFVIDADPERLADALRVATRLRQAGLSADVSYRRAALGKQLKLASSRAARFAVIVGAELGSRGVVAVKDLTSGQQSEVEASEVAAWLQARLRA